MSKLISVNKQAAAILDELTRDLDVCQSRKLDAGRGYMPVHIECLQVSGLGRHFSIAHYFEQNGDLVPDPDVVLVRRADGSWVPISFQNSIAYRVAVRWLEDGTIEVDERQQRDLASFVNTWMKNIREQQDLVSAQKS
jgi:hypothetical protein